MAGSLIIRKKALAFFIMVLVALPSLSMANGGDQRVVDGKYIINLSRAPFTPRIGVKTSMLASFADIGKGKLISEDLIAKIRIAKVTGGEREFLFEEDNITVKGGVLEIEYTFAAGGLHEIFIDFAFASDPGKIYESPDFLIDVQNKESPLGKTGTSRFVAGAMLSGVFGVAFGFWIGRRRTEK